MTKSIENSSKIVAQKLSDLDIRTYSQYLESFAPVFAPLLLEYLNDSRLQFESDKHADTDRYLYSPLADYTKNYGKLHRPLTLIAAYLACKGGDLSNVEEVFALSASIEFFQTAALIHDDIADDASLRRGKPCMHLKEGNGIAINAGDFGLAMTVASSLNGMKSTTFSDSKKIQIIEKLIQMEYMTIEGQAMDLGWARDERFDISEDDYIIMATKKSAYYSAAIPCSIAATAADADTEVISALESFGMKVGLAFQIQDDLINLIGDDNSKDFRSDISEGKRTLCVACALDLACEKDSQRLKEILISGTKEESDLSEAVEIMQASGAIQRAKDIALQLAGQAQDAIKNVLPESEWKTVLLDMAQWVTERVY